MAGYVCLAKFTPKGIDSIGAMPTQLKEARSRADTMGIRLVGIWVTMGAYDAVIVADAPNDQAMTRFVLDLARQGQLATHTMRALSEDEFAQVAGQMS